MDTNATVNTYRLAKAAKDAAESVCQAACLAAPLNEQLHLAVDEAAAPFRQAYDTAREALFTVLGQHLTSKEARSFAGPLDVLVQASKVAAQAR
ncbi:hypothetical protein [Solirubrum puertoriconensis]|uniref:Uncharacterized protein n=1 Tax=Solirubrum puertoriconensis TaxID=1751427 RepID=A0A9X0L3V6_SOLP1|nr:hypothetical protein [Solirubrum puertoriconensis]KUG06905.1 hypothetical protein ASU33_06160 [Solirubrum puertoriconensis]